MELMPDPIAVMDNAILVLKMKSHSYLIKEKYEGLTDQEKKDLEKLNRNLETVLADKAEAEEALEKDVFAYLSFEVIVCCPKCGQSCDLDTQLVDEDHDEMVTHLFGTTDNVADWDGYHVDFDCPCCHHTLKIRGIEH